MSDNKVLDNLLSEKDNYISQVDKENYILGPLLDEVNQIQDLGIRSFVRSMLIKADSFWSIPSYFNLPEDEIRMPDEASMAGNVLHTKRVFRIVKLMLQSYDLGEIDNDIMLAAALLHDITKAPTQGDEYDPVYDPYHAYTVDRFYQEADTFDQKYSADHESTTLYISDANAKRILRIIRCHMGPWSPIPETYPEDDMELMLHHADHLAHNLAYIIDGEEIKEERWLL